MISPERRQARRDFYRALDPKNAYQTIGYDYLGDETGLVLKEVPDSRQYRPLHQEEGGFGSPISRRSGPSRKARGFKKALAQATVPALISSARIWPGKGRAWPW